MPKRKQGDALHVVVATPIRVAAVNESKDIVEHATYLYERLTWPNKTRATYVNDDIATPGEPHFASHARVRNKLIEDIIASEEHGSADLVLWVDVDVVDYPADLIERLVENVDPLNGIIAPSVLVEDRADMGSWKVLKDRWYDVGAFIDVDGRHFREAPPYAGVSGSIVQVMSVGTCYLAPMRLYKPPASLRYVSEPDGARPTPFMYGAQVEHVHVCERALTAHQVPTWWRPDVVVRHVDAICYAKGIKGWKRCG